MPPTNSNDDTKLNNSESASIITEQEQKIKTRYVTLQTTSKILLVIGWTLRVIFIVIILAAVSTVVYFKLIAPVLKDTNRTELQSQLPVEATEVFNEHKVSIDEKHQQNIEQFKQLFQTQSNPVYSVSYNMCYTDHNDAGWTIINYNYHCQVSYVDFYETSLLHEKITSDIASYSFYNGGDLYDFIGIDMLLNTDESSKSSIRNNHVFITKTGVSTDAREFIDKETLTFVDIVSYATREAYDNRKILNESGNRTVDIQKRYLIFSDSNKYFTKNIGCAPGSLIFCESPLEE